MFSTFENQDFKWQLFESELLKKSLRPHLIAAVVLQTLLGICLK
jgi:hypothetical protein